MKYLAIIVFVLLIFTKSQAQNSLSGKIVDNQTEEGLIGATLYIPDIRKGCTSDQDGYYEITDLPKGTFLIEARYIGYATQLIKVPINGETIMDIKLSYTVTEMTEVIITGISTSTARYLNPVPTVVVNEVLIAENQSTNIVDAVSRQPGISMITTGGAISKPVIRGLGYNRVVVLHHGIRQEGQQWGDEHGVEIDQHSVGRVEIIKGPGSLMYGSDALAGVIHFLPPKPVNEGKIIGQLTTNFQTNQNHWDGSVMQAGNLNDIQWLVSLSGKKSGNYSNPFDGKVYNSGFKEFNFNGSLSITKKWGYSQVYFSNFNQSLGLVEGERDESGRFIRPLVVGGVVEEEIVPDEVLDGYKIGIPSQDIDHFRIGTSNKFFFAQSAISADIAFQQNRRKEFANPLNPQEVELYFLLNSFNYDIKYHLPQANHWETSVGISGMFQRSQNRGEEFLIPEYDLFDAGIFAFTQKTIDRFHFSGGVRFDTRNIDSYALYLDEDDEPADFPGNNTTTKFRGFETSFSNFSGTLGGSYRLTDKLIVKLNISKGFRAPNMAELGSNGIHEGTFRYEIGNPDLVPETSFQTDLGLSYTSEHIVAEISIFDNVIDNYIFLQKLSGSITIDSIVDPMDPAPAFKFVQGNANLYGGEIFLDLHPHPLDWLHFENTFSFVRGRQRNQPDSMRSLPFIPAPVIHSELRADFKQVNSRFQNIFVRFGVTHTFPQKRIFSAFGTETPTDAYTLVDAGFGMDILGGKGNTLFKFSVLAGNIFDLAYQSHLSRLKYAPENPATGRRGVYNMGRNFNFRLVVPLAISSKL
jgi:iron complex outermembrane receptor protein